VRSAPRSHRRQETDSASLGHEIDAYEASWKPTFGGDGLEQYAYDNASRLTGLTYKHGSNTLGALTYTYGMASRRTRVDRGTEPER
jgi:hypothetical protein